MMMTVAFIKAIFSLNMKILLSLVEILFPQLAPMLLRKRTEVQERVLTLLSPVMGKAKTCAFGVLLVWLVVLAAFVFSSILYSTVYYMVIPVHVQQVPLNFEMQKLTV